MARFPLSSTSVLESIDPSRRTRTPQAHARRDGPSTTEIAGASPEETCLFGEPRRGIRRRPWPIANEYRARPMSGGCSATMVFNLDCGSLRIDARRSINDGVRDQFAMGAGKESSAPKSIGKLVGEMPVVSEQHVRDLARACRSIAHDSIRACSYPPL